MPMEASARHLNPFNRKRKALRRLVVWDYRRGTGGRELRPQHDEHRHPEQDHKHSELSSKPVATHHATADTSHRAIQTVEKAIQPSHDHRPQHAPSSEPLHTTQPIRHETPEPNPAPITDISSHHPVTAHTGEPSGERKPSRHPAKHRRHKRFPKHRNRKSPTTPGTDAGVANPGNEAQPRATTAKIALIKIPLTNKFIFLLPFKKGGAVNDSPTTV